MASATTALAETGPLTSPTYLRAASAKNRVNYRLFEGTGHRTPTMKIDRWCGNGEITPGGTEQPVANHAAEPLSAKKRCHTHQFPFIENEDDPEQRVGRRNVPEPREH